VPKVTVGTARASDWLRSACRLSPRVAIISCGSAEVVEPKSVNDCPAPPSANCLTARVLPADVAVAVIPQSAILNYGTEVPQPWF